MLPLKTLGTTSIAFFLLLGVYSWQHILNWPIVRIWKASPWGTQISGDLRVVLHAAGCHSSNSEITYSLGTSADNCNVIYGRFLTDALGFFELNESHTDFISWIFIIVFSVLASAVTGVLTSKHGWKMGLVSLALFISPPVALLLERGNFDVLMSAAIYFSVWLSQKRWRLPALLVILLSALIKFYTLPLAFLASFTLFRGKARLLFVAITGITSIYLMYEYLARSLWFPDDPGASFGISTLPLWLNFVLEYLQVPLEFSKTARVLIGVVVLGLTIALFRRLSWAMPHWLPQAQDLTPEKLGMPYLFSLCVFLSCYFAGTNYDYRMTSWFILGILSVVKFFPLGRRIAPSLLLISTVWLSYNSGVVGQILGDILLTLCLSWIIAALVRGLSFSELWSKIRPIRTE